jgi:hypothetical protein
MRQPSAQLLPAFVPVNEACRYLGGRRRQLISDLARAGELEMLGDEHRRLISVRSLERVATKRLAETGRTGTGSAQLSQRLWKQCYRRIGDWPNALHPFSGTMKTFSATVRVQSKRMEFRAAATEI